MKTAEFRVADALALPFSENSFDAAAMALVIVFVDDPARAVREMVRVVRPGGTVAAYNWEYPDGFPLAPLAKAMQSLGMTPPHRANALASTRESMRAMWEQAGLASVETDVIRVRVSYADFDDFWDSSSVPAGPSGKALSELSPSVREVLKARLRQELPIGADRTICYEAFGNAVKGVVP